MAKARFRLHLLCEAGAVEAHFRRDVDLPVAPLLGMLVEFGRGAVIRPVITGIGYHLAERRYYLTARAEMDGEDSGTVRSIATEEGWEHVRDECRAKAAAAE